MTRALRDVLPPFYGDRLPALFDRPLIEEPRATCADCAMCDKSGGAEPKAGEAAFGFFRPDVKCCTYHPTLPNYLVGAALRASNEGEEGKKRLKRAIDKRIGVTPGWLSAPRTVRVLAEAARGTCFGRSPEGSLCPYYDKEQGNCTIWRHREAVCATFFCKHAAGASGHGFWMALKRVLIHVERLLARHAVATVSPRATEPRRAPLVLLPEDLAGAPPSEADYAGWWGPWVGREADYYVECARAVEAVSREQLEEMLDDETGREIMGAATARYEAVLSPRLAERLVLNPKRTAVKGEGGVLVTTYSRYDPLLLTDDLYAVLGELSAEEPVGQAIARLKAEHDVELPPELLLEMQLHGVVVPPDE